jgi:predicted dehydrogenase
VVCSGVTIAVIGAGYWGINHVRVFARLAGGELAWICDPDERALARAAALAPAARTTTDVDRVLADRAVDGVVIATPAVTHADLAIRALAAGKHALVEKPLALSIDDATRICAAADRAGRALVVGHLMLFHPAIVRLREIVRSGELGRLHYLYSSRVNLGRLRSDENALWSFGPHDLAMFDTLVGAAPVSVSARGAAYLQPGIEDVVFVSLRYPDGVMAHVHLSWLDPKKERRLTLVGSEKMAELDDVAVDGKLRIYDRGYDRPPEFTEFDQFLRIRQGEVHVPAVAMDEPLAVMARHFLACTRGEAAPITDGASGLRVVRVLAAAQASLAGDGMPVPVATAP